MTHGRRRTNRLVCFLCVLLRLINVGRLRQKLLAKVRGDKFAALIERILSDTRGIRTHVGDKAYRSFVAELYALIQALGNHHGAFHAETQLARGVLLELARGERRSCAAAPFLFLDRTHTPLRLAQSSCNLFRFFPIRNFGLLPLNSRETRIECGRLRRREVRINRPIFFLFERLDLAFALNDQTQGDRLYAASRESTANFVPQQWRYLVSDDAVEHAARLLRVHKIPVDLAGVLECRLHSFGSDLVEGHAMNGNSSTAFLHGLGFAEFLIQMRGNRLTFAIWIRREVNRIS